ncbi:hypothetical protein CCACVL1_30507 [Corchorus capsularis]|uniref:Retrovirus-related Pol polyprotein from transposon TNT 1-94-like beta-barrel domain-containing protein n=1 Tax=Corchorus capsularis TaxID=210143 RepID=A0A1R3FWV1_COCAP|nr:hypothetical protein CCACVL1_30507 [Corchorus capsularis]
MADTGSGSALKFEIEKFNGTNSFQMWQSTITDLLVQQGLRDALEADKPSAMDDNSWKDIQRKVVSTIRLSLATEIKYDVLDVKTPKEFMDKLESIYMSKSITNMLCLKRELFGLKMKEGTSLRAHLNEFNRLVTQLASVDEVMKEVDKAVLLINSLTDRYDPVTRALMVGRKTLSLQDVTFAIFEYDRLKETEKKDKESGALWSVEELMEEIIRMMQDQRAMKKEYQIRGLSEEYSDEDVVLMVQEEKKDTRDMWVFDSACSEHICTKKEWFSKLEKCDKPVYMANNGEEKIEGIGSVKLRLHDGSVKMLGNVRYVPNFTRNLISLGKLDSLGYGYSCQGGGLKITKGSMIVMKGVKNSKNLYELIESTIRGDGSVTCPTLAPTLLRKHGDGYDKVDLDPKAWTDSIAAVGKRNRSHLYGFSALEGRRVLLKRSSSQRPTTPTTPNHQNEGLALMITQALTEILPQIVAQIVPQIVPQVLPQILPGMLASMGSSPNANVVSPSSQHDSEATESKDGNDDENGDDGYGKRGKDVQGLQGSMKMHGDHGDIDNHVRSTKKMSFDPLKMLISPMTRVRAKRFKDALMGLVRTDLEDLKTIQVQLKSFDDDLSKKTPINYKFITLLAIDSRWPD